MLGLRPNTVYSSSSIEDYTSSDNIKTHRFSPYTENHGSVIAIAGKDFAIIASDTRLSGNGYGILTRDQEKLFTLSDNAILGSTGCWCDVLSMTKLVEARMTIYKNTHNKVMSTPATAQMLATILYSKRFFPYYVSNILAGLDENGKGVVYAYDPVGHMEKHTYRAGGSSVALLQPLLDNQVGRKNIKASHDITMDEAISMIHDLFISASEREIHTGDKISLRIITKKGIETRTWGLRRD